MGPKKKMSKKEKARLDAEQAEIARAEMEKEKMRKIEETRERKEKERAEAEKRLKQEIKENKIRRKQLKESSEYFQEINEKIQKIYAERKIQKEWDRYMRCNGLPNSQDPSDLRRYIHIWCKNIDENNFDEKNWLLKINESSILTQDQTILNLTSEMLRSQLPNLGDIYSNQIKEVLGILGEIEEAIDDIDQSKKSIIFDLNELKISFRELLNSHIDQYSFKILCNIDRDMNLQTPVIAIHLYESDVFKSELYTLRDIPQPPLNPKEKLKEETKPNEVNFDKLGLNIMFPPSVKCRGSAFRGVWLSYDNFSDYCPSFIIPYKRNISKDLRKTTKQEWIKRLEILESTLNEPEPECETEVIDEETEETPKSRIIDVDKMYMEYEDAINKEEQRKKGPEALYLAQYEINLRKYRIVGGIFGIDYIEQPRQDLNIAKKMYLRTLAYPNKLTRKKYFEAFIPPPPPQAGVRRLPEEIEEEMKYMEKNLDRLTLVTIQLTDNVLWFEPPIVCRWETNEETEISITEIARMAKEVFFKDQININKIEEKIKSETEETTNKVDDGRLKLDEDDETRIDISMIDDDKIEKKYHIKRQVIQIQDFNLYDIPNNINIYGLMTDFILPRLPDGYGIKLKIDENRKGSIMRYSKDSEEHDDSLLTFLKQNANDEKEIDNFSNNINSVLNETGSPRNYFLYKIKKIKKLKIIPLEKNLSESSTDEEFLTEDTSDNKQLKNYLQNQNKKIYMLSKFIKDLDEIFDMQLPKFQEKIEEIQMQLTPPKTPDKKGDDDDRVDSVLSLIKEDDDLYSDSFFLRKSNEPIPEIEIKEESITSSDLWDEHEQDFTDNEGTQKSSGKSCGRWSTRDIHDSKYNEEKLTIQFRTGRLGFFALASNRYSNIPYQTWELKPDSKNPNNVIFSLTAAVVSVEVTITSDGVRLNNMQGGPLAPVQSIIGITMPITKFIKELQSRAIDIFPDDDAFCYTDGTSEKNNAMESHLYQCMSSLALSHNFSWSRWNLLSGSRTAVILMREIIENKKIPHQSTLYVTPLKACIVDCLEVSPNFSTVGVAGMDYYADLYHLASEHSHKSSKEKQNSMCPVLRDNVAEILKATRPLSFC